jgi:hypothetical protein
MNIQRKAILIVFLIFLTPSTLFADVGLKNGYDLNHNIKLMDNPQSPEELVAVMHTTGYLAGYLDGLSLMQDAMFNMMFPKKFLSEKEIEKLSKESNVHRLNIPKDGLPTGQLILIYKKYAEKHPEKLNETARLCVFLSIVEAYGWK